MREICSNCDAEFALSYVYQLAITHGNVRRTYCSLECRQAGLGEEAFRASRARRIAILNHKGGTGKTTTAVNLAAGMAERGQRVLLIDTDAQGNVGVSLGVSGERSLYHVLVDGRSRGVSRFRFAITWTSSRATVHSRQQRSGWRVVRLGSVHGC